MEIMKTFSMSIYASTFLRLQRYRDKHKITMDIAINRLLDAEDELNKIKHKEVDNEQTND